MRHLYFNSFPCDFIFEAGDWVEIETSQIGVLHYL